MDVIIWHVNANFSFVINVVEHMGNVNVFKKLNSKWKEGCNLMSKEIEKDKKKKRNYLLLKNLKDQKGKNETLIYILSYLVV